MSDKDIQVKDVQFQKLLQDELYYRAIFKKTEKIVSVVFYILNNITANQKSETHISNIAGKAHFAHELALRSLEAKRVNAREVLEQFVQALIALDSTIRVATTAGVITPEVAGAVTTEIDGVLRGLSPYLEDEAGIAQLFTPERPHAPTRPARERVTRSAATTAGSPGNAASATPTASPAIDRRTRIATILEAKGESTIKDISEIITDVSEKTIQRELNAMIEEGQVQRQGERRWSKYSLN